MPKQRLATAAFPIGLKARVMARHTSEYSNMAWPIEMDEEQKQIFDEGKPIAPAWPKDIWGNVEYTVNFVAVDGGTIDNEPFELARWSIRDMSRKRNPRNALSSDRAVIMIDPVSLGKQCGCQQDPEEQGWRPFAVLCCQGRWCRP